MGEIFIVSTPRESGGSELPENMMFGLNFELAGFSEFGAGWHHVLVEKEGSRVAAVQFNRMKSRTV